MTIAELRARIAAKEKHVSKLRRQRQKVAKQLAALDRDLAALGGRAVKAKPKAAKKTKRKIAAKRGRARSQPSLADVLAKVLVGRGGVKVAEAGKLALAAGYKTVSSQFGNIVGQTLTSDKRFKKVSRGVYALKAAGKVAAKKAGKVGRGAKKPLAQYLAEALATTDTGMRAMDLAAAVLKAGYSTKDKDFKQSVARILAVDKRFQRVDRGVYKLA